MTPQVKDQAKDKTIGDSSLIAALRSYWSVTFNDVPPVAERFRDDFSTRWARFHSLPESKRYTNSKAEYKIILARHNTVRNILIKSTHIVLVTASYSESSSPKAKRGHRFQKKIHWQSVPLHQLDDSYASSQHLHVFVQPRKWTSGVLDNVLSKVADDKIGNVFIFSLTDTWLYHAYDGGADIIFPNSEARNKFQIDHVDWLSAHPRWM